MAYRSADFDGHSATTPAYPDPDNPRFPNPSSTYRPVVDFTPIVGLEHIVKNGLGADRIDVGDHVDYYFSFDTQDAGGPNEAIYLGYYLDDGVEHPLLASPAAGYYYFLGESDTSRSYSIHQAPYDQGTTCYVTGTRIRTCRGGTEADVAVEDLRVGDLAVTASGAHRPIRWIGHRTLDPRRHPRPHEAQPVRIRAGAFGTNRPARDLRVSPGHSIAFDLLGEVLIPAARLVNGATIVQDEVESVTYWHVELDRHDLLVAENQPAESYLDMGNRGFFAERTSVALDGGPDADPASRTHADFCRPYHDGGPLLDAVHAQLRRRVAAQGWRVTRPEAWTDVYLDVDGRRVRPKPHGLSASFELPADTGDVWLISRTGMPCAVGDSPDGRALGLSLAGLRVDDGLTVRTIALDDPRLGEGFHGFEGRHRWTAGRARLPAALWAGLEGRMVLRVDLDAPALPRWTAVGAEAGAAAPEAPTASQQAPRALAA